MFSLAVTVRGPLRGRYIHQVLEYSGCRCRYRTAIRLLAGHAAKGLPIGTGQYKTSQTRMHLNRKAICMAILYFNPILIIASGCANNPRSTMSISDMKAERRQAKGAVFLQISDRLLKALQAGDSSFLILIARPTRCDLLEWRLLTDSLGAFESIVRENHLDGSANATRYTIRKAFHNYEAQPCAIA